MKAPKLEKMPKQEKKKFLSMDLAERMIRVEQNVSSAFNKSVPYNQTEYYKSMSSTEKEQFEQFLKNKTKKKFLSIFGLIIPLIGLFFFSTSFTGNVIKESIGESSFNYLFLGLGIFIGLMIAILLYSFYRKKSRDKIFNSHASIINNIFVEKGSTKSTRKVFKQ